MKINNRYDELQNLVDLIKETNPGIALEKSDITVASPVEIAETAQYDPSNPNASPISLNTSIDITATATSLLYQGSFNFKYRRLDIEEQWKIVHTDYTLNYNSSEDSEWTEDKLKAYVKERISYMPNSVSVIVNVSDTAAVATFESIDNSLCYTKKVFSVTVMRPAPQKKDLSSVFSSTTDKGFNYALTVNMTGVNAGGYAYSD